MNVRAAACLALAFGGASRLCAQQPPVLGVRGSQLSVVVQPDTVRLGDPFTVRIRVRAPKNAAIVFPPVPDTGDAVEALDPRFIEDTADQAVLDRTAVYRLIAWDVGVRTPRFDAVVVSTGGVSQRFAVIGAGVTVRSLLPADSADRVPKDARDPLPLPSGWWRFAIVGVLAATALLWYLRRRRRGRAAIPTPAPEAFAAAKAAFSALDTMGLADSGEPGRHVIAHVDVLRRYVSKCMPSAGESLTPFEFVRAVAASEISVPAQRVHTLLERDADIRFARAVVSGADAATLATEARALVQDVQRALEARRREDERLRARTRRGRKVS